MFDKRESFGGDGGAIAMLGSDALIAQLRGLAGEERRIQAAFLVRLDEFDRRRAYLDAGYGSLWDWCLRDLHLSEGAAGRRITAMRVIRDFPRVLDAIRDGRLSLSSAVVLGPVLTEENHEDLIARAAYGSKSEVDHLVASVRPREAPKDGIRKLPSAPPSLPAPVGVAAPAVPEAPAAPESPDESDEQSRSSSAVEERGTSAEIAPAPVRAEDQGRAGRAEIRPVAEERWSVRVTLDTVSKQELDLLQHLLSHKCGRDLAGVLREAIRCGIEKHGKRRGAIPTRTKRANVAKPEATKANVVKPDASAFRPTSTSPARRRESGSDAIPAAVKQAVYDRDGGCCAFVSAGGRRCGSRWKLEFDHVHSAFLDGPATIDNIRLACRAHNLHHAEQVFGREHMEKFRRRGPEAGHAPPDLAGHAPPDLAGHAPT